MQYPREPTAFECRVYEVVRGIPSGRVATYAWVASRAGCGSARAVAQALRRNPFAPAVPCHRVIGSDRRPGGFRGSVSGAPVREKVRMLAAEGVCFGEDGRVAAGGLLA